MVSLEIFIDIKSFRSHYGPGFDSASNRNEYQDYFLGVKLAGTKAYNLPPSWEPSWIPTKQHQNIKRRKTITARVSWETKFSTAGYVNNISLYTSLPKLPSSSTNTNSKNVIPPPRDCMTLMIMVCGLMSHGAMLALAKLLVGPPMPDWSVTKTQTKKQSNRSSRIAGGWT